MLKGFEIKNYYWALYPLLVAGIMVFGTQTLVFNQTSWASLANSNSDAVATQEKISTLRNKVATLSTVDLAAQDAKLKELVKMVPSTKMVWLLVSQIQQSATEAGVTLDSYKATVGQVSEASESAAMVPEEVPYSLTANLTVPDLLRLSRLVNSLESMLPLVKINSIRYESGRVELIVEGAWSSWQREADLINTPLPDFDATANLAIAKVANFTQMSAIQTEATDSGERVSNPF